MWPCSPKAFPALSLEVDRRGVEENQLEIGEEIAAVGEQIFLDSVLDTTGSERRLVLLLVLGQHFTQPGHGPVEMVQLKRVTALDLIMLLPFVGGSITAGDEETMQHGKEDGSLDVELETAPCQKLLDDALAAGLLPEPAKDREPARCAWS